MGHKIQVRRGAKESIPILSTGEFGFASDTGDVFIGGFDGQNVEVGGNSVRAQLAQTVTDIESRSINAKINGLKGDGTDESLKIKEIAERAYTEGKAIFLSSGEYHIYQSTVGLSSFNFPSIEGQSLANTKLVIHGQLGFNIKSGFRCKNITIETDFQKPNTDITSAGTTFSNNIEMLKNVSFENVDLINIGSVVNGSSRGMGLFSGYVDGLNIQTVNINGSRGGFTVKNDNPLLGVSGNININGLHFENVQTGFYIQGVDGFDHDLYVRSVAVNNISLKNTEEQKQNYSRFDGADLLMFEKTIDVFVTSFYCERAVERATYFNGCHNVNMTGVELLSSAGLKFVGQSSSEIGEQYADGFTVSNIHVKDKDNLGTYQHYYPFYLYDCKNVTINGINLDGKGVNTKIERLLLTERYLENINISNVVARYMMAGLFYYVDDSNLTLKAGVKGLHFKNIDLIDCVIRTDTQPLINFKPSVIPANGTYLFEDIEVENLTSISTIDRTVTPLSLNSAKHIGRGNGNSPVRSIIELNHVNGLRTKNNVINGFASTTTPIYVELNMKNVIVEENNMWVATDKTAAQTYGANYSFPSRIRKVTQNLVKGSNYEEVFEVATQVGDLEGVAKNIMKATNFTYKATVKLNTLETGIVIPHWYNSSFATGKIFASNGEWVEFIANGYTTKLVASSANFTIADESGKSRVWTTGASDYDIKLYNGTTGTLTYQIEIKGFKQT